IFVLEPRPVRNAEFMIIHVKLIIANIKQEHIKGYKNNSAYLFKCIHCIYHAQLAQQKMENRDQKLEMKAIKICSYCRRMK
ncbi:MAG: hypothetical protein WD512_11825, partial [Candidatus Paceibacterota bacterium]